MGVVYLTQHLFDLALSHFQEGLILAKKIGDDAAKAAIFNNIGNLHKMKGEYDSAIRFYTDALLIDEKLHVIVGMINRIRNIGHIQELKTRYDLARDFYRKSLIKSKELENPREIDQSLIALGVLDYKEKKYNDALKNLVRAKLNSEKRKDWIVLTTIYYNIALVYFDQGKIDDSCYELKKAFKLNRKIKLRDGIMHNKLLYGKILNKRGNFRVALTQLEESYQLSQEFQDLRHQGFTLQAMGLVRKNMGEYNLAIDKFMKALKIAEDLEDFYGQVVLLRNIALCHAKNDNKSSAKSSLNRALEFFKLRKIVDPTLEAIIRNNLKKFS
ncbi:hypothetical protein LCGC14_1789620 [marine sediment metagenome]|uniref:Uncharacterized protein n=1 Tax=marine sediment metagenome TaxID=412755 RepID=A0A0F9JSI4_9ZZZZ